MKKYYNFVKKYGIDWFILSIGLVILISYLNPAIGTIQYPINLKSVAGYGVSMVFFFYGLRINPTQFKQELGNWKMHVVIQLSTFLLFPVILLIIKPFFPTDDSTFLWLSIFFLASLPSTVSSSVVMVSIAKGNIPGAIFNASISSLAGIFITPAWMGLFISTTSLEIDSTDIIYKLTIQILLPVIIGSILNKKLGKWADKHKLRLKIFDQIVILLIVFTSFSQSFSDNIFEQFKLDTIIFIAIGMILLFYFMFLIMNIISKIMKFNTEDKITVLFCGSKKSLIHAVVMSKVIFMGSSITGLMLLPIMLYHPLQLISVSIIANRFAKRNEKKL